MAYKGGSGEEEETGLLKSTVLYRYKYTHFFYTIYVHNNLVLWILSAKKINLRGVFQFSHAVQIRAWFQLH